MDLEKLLQAGDLAQQAGEYVEAESIWRRFLKHGTILIMRMSTSS